MGFKVLVVEDNPLNVELVTALLEADGHDFVVALDAHQAIKMAKDEDPSLILMDLQLPGGVDGLEATRRLKADPTTRQIPIVAVTAHAFKEILASATEAGCDSYLTKPIDSVSFLDLIAGYAEKSN